MLYTIVGTHKAIREKASKELASLGVATHHLYSEKVYELEPLINASSLFGETVIAVCIQLGEEVSSKEELLRFLKDMELSKNIFIIDEPFADVHLVNKLSKVSKKLFDAREEKVKDKSVFKLCDSFITRDKKQAWLDFLAVKKDASGESIQGALWWKFQMEWQGVRDGKRSLFSVEDCERIGGDLVRSTILAHRGERDLMVELERIVLSL